MSISSLSFELYRVRSVPRRRQSYNRAAAVEIAREKRTDYNISKEGSAKRTNIMARQLFLRLAYSHKHIRTVWVWGIHIS